MANSEWRIGQVHSPFATHHSLPTTFPRTGEFQARTSRRCAAAGKAASRTAATDAGGISKSGLSSASLPQSCSRRSRTQAVSTPESMIRCATWMFFGPEFARHRLRHRAQSEFGAGKGRKAAAAAQGRGGAGEEDVALAARHHQPGRFASGQEAGPAGHLPHLAEHAVGGLQDRKVDVGADVEDADFQRRVLVGVIEEGRDLVFLPRIERARDDRSARGLDLLDQRLELGAVAPARRTR